MYTDTCPVCGGKEFQYDDTNLEGDLLVEKCYCNSCDSTWEEVWAFVENRQIVDARITE